MIEWRLLEFKVEETRELSMLSVNCRFLCANLADTQLSRLTYLMRMSDSENSEYSFFSDDLRGKSKRKHRGNNSHQRLGRWTEGEHLFYLGFVQTYPELLEKANTRAIRIFQQMS